MDLPMPMGVATATFRTRYSDEGHLSPVPRELWIDVRGGGDYSLEEAIDAYWNAANQVLPSLAVACNAPVSDAEVHLAIAIDPEGTEHEFFENFQPDESGRPRHGRSLVFPETTTFLDALVQSPHSARILRACAFYREALHYLKQGTEVLHVAFLWMAVEALTKVALRRACEAEACSEDELVTRWLLVAGDADQERLADAKKGLDGEARRQLIFHGDAECQRAAVKASDGFEHGFEDFAKVRALARCAMAAGVRHHVRRAILELADVPDQTRNRLLGGAFEKPRANWPMTKYVRGKFIGPPSSLAAPSEEYPILHWEGKLVGFERTAEGHRVSFTEKMTVVAGEGVTFQADSFQVWGPENDPTPSEETPSGDTSGASS
ncbi:MAG: hypothetical protein M3N45_08865 [Actinomycetota bacterium]|nr:hypothetical protein [Actinomycetota bacterium]